MSLLMFRSQQSIKRLRSDLESNPEEWLDRYRSGDFKQFLKDDPTAIVDNDFSEVSLAELQLGQSADLDIENAAIIWEKFNKVTPRVARQPRFWIYLTLATGLDYTRSRWPLDPNNDEKAVKQVLDHYIPGNDKRDVDRDQALSRLWISAYLCSKIEELTLLEALKLLHSSRDFRENIVGRPYIFRSHKVLNAFFKVTRQILEDDERILKRQIYRPWIVRIDVEGGRTLLDGLSHGQLEKMMMEFADEILESV
jgi:hypothetical protein